MSEASDAGTMQDQAGAADAEASPRFEAILEELERLVKRLEDGSLPLEESLAVFERGMKLARMGHERLAEAERRVEVLLRQRDGTAEVQPFEPTASPGTS